MNTNKTMYIYIYIDEDMNMNILYTYVAHIKCPTTKHPNSICPTVWIVPHSITSLTNVSCH